MEQEKHMSTRCRAFRSLKRVAAGLCLGLFLALSGVLAMSLPAFAAETVEIDEGIYVITGAGSGKPLDVASGTQANCANVQIYTDGSKLTQRWNVKKVGEHYVLLSAGSSYALDVSCGSSANCTNVQLYEENDTNAQLWDFVYDEDEDAYILKSCLGDVVLDVSCGSSADGANVQIYESNGTAAQKWQLTPINRTVEDGLYTVASALDDSKVLDVASGSRNDCAAVQLYDSNGTRAQKWQLTYDESTGYYTVLAACSSMALDVPGASTTAGKCLIQYTANGTSAQRWTIKHNEEEETYTFVSGCSGLVLDVPCGAAKNCTPIQTWSSNDTSAQKWTLTPTSLVQDGLYRFDSIVNEDYVIDVASGSTSADARIQVYTSNSTLAQKWVVANLGDGLYSIRGAISGLYLADSSGTLVGASTVSETSSWRASLGLKGGTVFINASTGKAIDLTSGLAYGANRVGTYAANSTAAQSWMLTSVPIIEEGYYVFYNMSKTSQALDVPSGSSSSGVKLQSYDANGTGAQTWYVKNEGDGYSITNANSGLALDVVSGIAQSGNRVQQYADNDTKAQRWTFSISEQGGLVIQSALGDLVLSLDGGMAANGVAAIVSSSNSSDASQRWSFDKVSYSTYAEEDIWGDSSYISSMRTKVAKYGSNTEWALVTDIDKCRVLAFHKQAGGWVCVKTMDCALGRYERNGGQSNTFSGVYKIVRQAVDLYNADGYVTVTDGNGNRYDCASWWSCFVDVTSSNPTDGYRISEGLYENGQGYHWAEEKQYGTHSTSGCVTFQDKQYPKWIYDNIPIGSTVINFASYDGDNLHDYR